MIAVRRVLRTSAVAGLVVVAYVGGVLTGVVGSHDPGPTERFVERFVRPRGLAEPVAPIVAAAALELTGAQPAPLGGAA